MEVQWHGKSCSHISKGSLVKLTIGRRRGSAVAWEKLLTYFKGFLCQVNNWRTPPWKCSGMGISCSHISKGSLVKLTIGGRRSGSAVACEKLLTYFKGFLCQVNNWRTPQWKCSGMGISCSHVSKGSLVQFTIGGRRSGSAVAWEKVPHIFQRVPWSNSQLEDAAVEVQWHGKKFLTYFEGSHGPIHNWRTPQWKCSGMGKGCSHISVGSLVKFTIQGRSSGSAVAWEKLLTYFKGFLGPIHNWRMPQWKSSGMGQSCSHISKCFLVQFTIGGRRSGNAVACEKAAHIFPRVPWSNLPLEDAASAVAWEKLLAYFKGFLGPFHNWRTPQWKCSGMGKSCSHISKGSFVKFTIGGRRSGSAVAWKSCSHISKGFLVKFTIGGRRSGSAVAWEKLLTRFKGFLGQVNNWTTPQWKCSGMGKAAHIFPKVPLSNSQLEDAVVEVRWHGKSCSHISKCFLVKFTIGGRRSGSAVAWEKLLTYFKGFLGQIHNWRTLQWKCSGTGKAAHIFPRIPWSQPVPLTPPNQTRFSQWVEN